MKSHHLRLRVLVAILPGLSVALVTAIPRFRARCRAHAVLAGTPRISRSQNFRSLLRTAQVIRASLIGLTLGFPAAAADLRLGPPTRLERAVVQKKPANVASTTKVFVPCRRLLKVASEQDLGGFAGSRGVGLYIGVGF
jgi:hypothetical protein